jgi:hypothetical protein
LYQAIEIHGDMFRRSEIRQVTLRKDGANWSGASLRRADAATPVLGDRSDSAKSAARGAILLRKQAIKMNEIRNLMAI